MVRMNVTGDNNSISIDVDAKTWADFDRFAIIDGVAYFNGEKITTFPNDSKEIKVSVVKGRLYINGYEWKKWTLGQRFKIPVASVFLTICF